MPARRRHRIRAIHPMPSGARRWNRRTPRREEAARSPRRPVRCYRSRRCPLAASRPCVVLGNPCGERGGDRRDYHPCPAAESNPSDPPHVQRRTRGRARSFGQGGSGRRDGVLHGVSDFFGVRIGKRKKGRHPIRHTTPFHNIVHYTFLDQILSNRIVNPARRHRRSLRLPASAIAGSHATVVELAGGDNRVGVGSALRVC